MTTEELLAVDLRELEVELARKRHEVLESAKLIKVMWTKAKTPETRAVAFMVRDLFLKSLDDTRKSVTEIFGDGLPSDVQ